MAWTRLPPETMPSARNYSYHGTRHQHPARKGMNLAQALCGRRRPSRAAVALATRRPARPQAVPGCGLVSVSPCRPHKPLELLKVVRRGRCCLSEALAAVPLRGEPGPRAAL